MGDRDGADERAEEESPESRPDDSADDQQVPSSDAADATDEAGDDETPEPSVDRTPGDGQHRSETDPAASAAETDDSAGSDDSGGGATADAPSTEEDDPDEWWTDHQPADVVDEEPTGDGSAPEDESRGDNSEDGESTADAADQSDHDDLLNPAARRNQVEKVSGTRDDIGPPTDDERASDEEDPGGHAGDEQTDERDEEAADGQDADEQADGQDGDEQADGQNGDEQAADGGGAASAGGPAGAMGRGATARPDPTEQGGWQPEHEPEPSTAPDDEEMPLTEHVEEMALRLLAVGLVMFGVAGIVVFYADNLINFLWYSFLGDATACPGPNCDVKPRVYHPLSLVLARLKVSTMVGLIIALPVGVYQTYRFMRPGLYPRERRYYLAAVPTSVVLATVGVGFAYFAVLPSLFAYFTQYSEQAATTAFGLTETFNLIVLMLGFFALIFQIPLLVMLAIMMGVTSRQWMEDRRLYFWGGFAAVAFVFSPDPTGMAPLIVAVTMIILFEGTLTLLRWTGTGSPIPTAEEAADARPLAYLAAALGGYIASSGPLPPGYYGALPTQVTDALANAGGPIATPAILAGVLIALFELGALLLRRFGRSQRALKARLAVDSARIPIWLGAAVIGYFGSPNPTLVIAAENLALSPVQAGAVAVGLIVLYELFVAGLRWRAGNNVDDGVAEDDTVDEV